MLNRFRSLAVSVIRRGRALKAFQNLPPPLPPPENADGSETSQPVSMEYIWKLQRDYEDLLAKVNSMTDKLNPRNRRQHSLWASIAVEEYFDYIFRAYKKYKKLLPYWDPRMLPSFGWHANHKVVRTKVLNRIVEYPNLLGHAMRLRGQEAAALLSLIQEELDSPHEVTNRAGILNLLRDLSDASGELPASYWLVGVKRTTRRAYGGEAEIWVGTHNRDEVAVRDFWFPSEMSPEHLQKIIRREIIANRQLNHQNILRLTGVFSEADRPMAVVTPWMPNGIASMYLESHPVDLLRILRGTIDGMQYLHSLDPPIIHGSVQPRNILINSDGDPVIRDLGITRVRMEAIKSIDERIAGFSPRYQAPELMMPPKTLPDGTVRSHASHLEVSLSLAADVYSLAMTFYHFITLIQPFHTSSHPDLISPASIIRAVISGERPPAPQLEEHRLPASGGNLYDEDLAELYGILKEMWSTKPDQRPSTADVASRIMKLENRPACQGCLDAHRSTECRRATDDAPCDHCVENKAECTAPPENGGPSAAGYGLNAGNREATDGGYYITTLELPPSPEGALAPGQTLETRRVRLVPFQWQRRRRVSSSQASRSNR